MRKVVDRLLTVKSLVTLALTATFCYQVIVGMPVDQPFLSIFTVVIGFYFGTQAERYSQRLEEENNGSEQETTQ